MLQAISTKRKPSECERLSRASVDGVTSIYGQSASSRTWEIVGFGFDDSIPRDKAESYLTRTAGDNRASFSFGSDVIDISSIVDISEVDKSEGLTDEQIDGWWSISRTGTWQGWEDGEPCEFEITVADLSAIAEDYDRNVTEAPIDLDHMHWGPAYGWVSELRVIGDVLEAKFAQIDPALRYDLKRGAYRSRSAEIYFDFNGTGRPYLGGVAFLGAANPAVSGLPADPSAFSAGRQVACFTGSDSPTGLKQLVTAKLSEREEVTMKDDEKKSIVSEVIDGVKGMFASKEDVTAASGSVETLTAAVTALTEQNAELKSAMEAAKADAEAASFSASIDEAVRGHKVPPAEAAALKESASVLTVDARKSLLEGIEKREASKVFAELTAKEGEAVVATGSADDKLAAAAEKIVAESDGKVSFSAAVIQVVAGNPALDTSFDGPEVQRI